MKKHVLIASVLIAGAGLYAQNGKIQRPSNAVPVNMAEREMKKQNIHEPNASVATSERKNTVRPKLNANRNGSGHQQIAVASATRFSGSRNVYGVLVSNQKPLQYNSDIDIVTFVHRASPYFITAPVDNSGSIVASWSLNKGTSWDSTCIWADGTNLGRYPNGGIYNPPGNTNVNNIYFVGTGPAVASNWAGNWYASKPYTASVGGNNTALSAPNTQFIPSAYMGSKQDMVRYYYTYTTDGIVRAAGLIVEDINATTNYNLRGMAIMRGMFNAGSFNWVLDSLIYSAIVITSSVYGNALVSIPYMAWSNDGTIGYAVMMGARQGTTGTMKGIQPIVYKTTNSGATWTLIPPFDFTTLPEVDKRLLPIATGSNTFAIPFFSSGEGFDVTVDVNGNLHLVGTVISASKDHNDSLFYVYQFNSGGGCGPQNYLYWYGSTTTHPTIMDFVLYGNNTWNGIIVDSMATESTRGGDNTCSQWDAAGLDIDARIQVSRNDVGDKIFYSWTETDTAVTGHHFNVYPDLYMKAYDVNASLVTNKMLVIGTSAPSPPAAASGIFWHYMSPRAISVGGGVYEVPFTFSGDLTFGGTSPVDHYYISGAQVTSADFLYTPIPLSVGKSTTSISKINVEASVFPNPTNGTTQLVVNLDKASDIHVEILNTLGQVVNKMDIKGEAGKHVINVDLSNENAGIYFYNVTTNVGKVNGKIVRQ